MTHLARDIMQSHVVTVAPETSIADAIRLFVEEDIGGAPVVDEEGLLCGVVSARDLLRAVAEEHDSPTGGPEYFREDREFAAREGGSDLEDFQDRLGERAVGDVMTESCLTVSPDTPVDTLARLFREHRVHRLLVVEGRNLVGIVTTFDLLALFDKALGGAGL